MASAERCQRRIARMTPTSVTVLIAKSRKTPTRPSRIWPITGPTVRARLKPAELSAIAGRRRGPETISGTTACQAGAFMALPRPMQKLRASRFQAVSWPRKANTARVAATAIIQNWQPMI